MLISELWNIMTSRETNDQIEVVYDVNVIRMTEMVLSEKQVECI